MAVENNQPAERVPGTFVGNSGEPIRFAHITWLEGFSGGTAIGGQQLHVWTRLALTSEDTLFHRIVYSFRDALTHMAQQNHIALNIETVNTLLFVMKADQSAELWLDTAAVMVEAVAKRALGAGHVVFEDDIADIIAIKFPDVNIQPNDRVLCILREGWRFALAFDFNPDGNFDLVGFGKSLGTLSRTTRYRHVYDLIENNALFDELMAAGWFPFVEILGREIKLLGDFATMTGGLEQVEPRILVAFDQARLDRIYDRWLTKPHFASRAAILKSGLDAFARGDSIACLKTLATEIEGILNDAYRSAHNGHGARIKELLRWVIEIATARAGLPNTLMFPASFARYLDQHTFANFDPATSTGHAGSRHAVGHGAASESTYTPVRALQTILALDQLMFYT